MAEARRTEQSSTPRQGSSEMERTRRAILEYEVGDISRADMLRNAKYRDTVEAWEKAEADALEKLQRAFLADTSDRNTWEQVKMMDYHDIVREFLGE